MYHKLLNKGNGDHKFLTCPDLIYNNFEVLRSAISLDKVEFECAETVKAKPTRNDSGFITYSNTINFASK